MRLLIKDGHVKEHGVDRGPKPGVVLARNEDYLIVKWPGHSYWAARNSYNYAPTSRDVYRIVEQNDTGTVLTVEGLIGYEGRG